jgi:hypothetical protein
MSQKYTIRGGRSVPVDEVFEAWTSGDLHRMLRALNLKSNPIDRHYLLMGIVEQTFKQRSDSVMAHECERVAEIHLAEFPNIVPALKQEMGGELPRVTTFQNYATLLAERGQFEKAIDVCKLALSYGLHDNTKSGFEGRIERIKKQQSQAV